MSADQKGICLLRNDPDGFVFKFQKVISIIVLQQ